MKRLGVLTKGRGPAARDYSKLGSQSQRHRHQHLRQNKAGPERRADWAVGRKGATACPQQAMWEARARPNSEEVVGAICQTALRT